MSNLYRNVYNKIIGLSVIDLGISPNDAERLQNDIMSLNEHFCIVFDGRVINADIQKELKILDDFVERVKKACHAYGSETSRSESGVREYTGLMPDDARYMYEHMRNILNLLGE